MLGDSERVNQTERVKRFLNGESTDCYRFLGSRLSVKTANGVKKAGVSFSVWAPNAAAVRVVGDFNWWGSPAFEEYEKRRNLRGVMKKSQLGVWSCFIEGLTEGVLYKYEITSADGDKFLKADPMCYSNELRPNTASVVYELKRYAWNDENGEAQRKCKLFSFARQ